MLPIKGHNKGLSFYLQKRAPEPCGGDPGPDQACPGSRGQGKGPPDGAQHHPAAASAAGTGAQGHGADRSRPAGTARWSCVHYTAHIIPYIVDILEKDV